MTGVDPSAVVQIYTVELWDNGVANGLFADLGLLVTNLGIQVTLSDLTTPTGILASDIATMRLFRSADATFDATDVLIDTQTPTGADRRLPDLPNSIFFIVVASISPSATLGTAFRLGAAAGHIGITETGIGGSSGVIGSLIVASDADNITIGDVATTSGGVPVTIPFGGETTMLLLLVGSGLYVVRRVG